MTQLNTDILSNIIRKVDGNHDLGAGALAEAILEELRTSVFSVDDLADAIPQNTGAWRNGVHYVNVTLNTDQRKAMAQAVVDQILGQ